MNIRPYKIREKIQEKGRWVLVGLFLVSFLAFLLIFWKGLPRAEEMREEMRKREISFEFEVFEEEEFDRLRVFEGASLPEEVGRDNPFLWGPQPEEEKEEKGPETSPAEE